MQTMYLVLVEKSGAEDGLSSMDLMFYNSLLSLPFLFFLIIATGEFPLSLSVLYAKVSAMNLHNLFEEIKRIRIVKIKYNT
jgi:solute carrier family 35